MARRKEKEIPKIYCEWTKKQEKAWEYLLIDKQTTEILFGGGAGSGKSWLGCAWLIYNCVNYPGTRWLLGRIKLSELKQTTLVTLFKVLAKWQFTNENYTYNQQANTITFWNKSEIILKDLFNLRLF